MDTWTRVTCGLCSSTTLAPRGTKNRFGLRPVFTLKSGIKLTGGDGVNTPYTLAP